ncbi:glutamate 5-kinase [bacterium]|nr:glutamate 5-kinase [bacterium]
MEERRQRLISAVRRVVVKIGSNVLATPDFALDDKVVSRISTDLSKAMDQGYKLVVVSSGAILAGMSKLALKEKPCLIKQKQAVAAVGQATLIRTYEKHFEALGKKVAQILLTNGEMSHRKRYINARNTMETLFGYNVLPIVNENDTVAVDEIKMGDNDTLSGVVSQMIEADLLIILSDVDGLYTADPNRYTDARFIPLVDTINQDIYSLAEGVSSFIGTGGMVTKIRTAQAAAKSGTATIIVNGRTPSVVSRILSGEEIGTLFIPDEEKLNSRKSWIAFALKPRGSIIVDEGACNALIVDNKSLLPSGVMDVKGDFDSGDPVSLISPNDKEFARGLVNYSSSEIARIKGIKSCFIEQILGYCTSDEVIHRDNLAIL